MASFARRQVARLIKPGNITKKTKQKKNKTNKQTNKKKPERKGYSVPHWLFMDGKSQIILIYPANICWSWRRLQEKTSSTRLQCNNFMSSKTSWRSLEEVIVAVKTSWRHILKTSWRHVLKTSWRHVLKMSRRHVLKTSWRHYGDKQNTYWGYLYLTNLNVYLTNLYLTNLHLTILRRIQNALSRTHHFNICLILELKQHLYFKN